MDPDADEETAHTPTATRRPDRPTTPPTPVPPSDSSPPTESRVGWDSQAPHSRTPDSQAPDSQAPEEAAPGPLSRLPTASRDGPPRPSPLEVEVSRRRATASRGDEPPEADDDAPPQDPLLPSGAVFTVSSTMELTCLRELGRGGMGVVYLVRDPRLGRLAALKLLRVKPTPRRLARFRREAAITAHLDHPGIPPVYEAGRTGEGRDFLLLRYVEGRSLADALDRLEERRLRQRQRGQAPDAAPRDLLEALVEVGLALAYAHSRGIVHRDLKPGNVMLGPFGEVLVMDWGLARDLRESEQADVSFRAQLDLLPVETRDGAFLGTLGYMAPEQARGEEVDARADVFGLGALLCEVLTGQLPFEGETTSEVLETTRGGKVRLPGQLDRHVPPELDAIARRALDPARELRYASAADFARDLKAWLEGRRVSVYHYSPAVRLLRWVRSHPTFSVAMLLICMAGLLAEYARRMERGAQIEAARADYERRAAELERPLEGLEEQLGRAWAALQAANTWGQVDPTSHEAALARHRAALALGDVALQGRQWSLARQAYLQAQSLGLGDQVQVGALLDRVEAAREAELGRRRATVRQVLEQVESGRTSHPDQLRDAVLDVVYQGEPSEVVPLLTDRLQAISSAMRQVERDLLLSAAVPDREERARGERVIEGLEAAIDAQAELAPQELPWREHRKRLAAAIARLEDRARRQFRPPQLDAWLELLGERQREVLGAGQLNLAWVIVEALGRLGQREAAQKALLDHLAALAEPGPATSTLRALERLGASEPALALVRRRFGALPEVDAWPSELHDWEQGPRRAE